MKLQHPKASLALLAGLVLGAACGPAQALYKVVNPDGTVTYTDRPPAPSSARVTPMGRQGRAAAEAAPEASLPPELRQAVQRHPVTLYTTPDCASCNDGRRLLLQRGVPFTERSVTTEEDIAALERQTNVRSVPVLMVGVQPLRGFVGSDWTSYLDAAGYPATSRLPRGWQQPPATPLAPRATPAAAAAAAAAPAPAPAPAASAPEAGAEPAGPGRIRF